VGRTFSCVYKARGGHPFLLRKREQHTFTASCTSLSSPIQESSRNVSSVFVSCSTNPELCWSVFCAWRLLYTALSHRKKRRHGKHTCMYGVRAGDAHICAEPNFPFVGLCSYRAERQRARARERVAIPRLRTELCAKRACSCKLPSWT
jgi:hypothetical protein